MQSLLMTSFLLAGLSGGLGYHQITWSTSQMVFGAPRSPSTVPMENWAETFRMGELAWSLRSDEFAAAGGVPDLGNVLAERSQ
ncbi:MAG: hypothetical protein JO220_21450 [Hyphomicrobiales bacterium]|nr:hypothetical protein [Hyphomicrobiales bacterium]